MAARHGLELSTAGLPALISFSFASDDHLKYKTLITQEMLKRGFLASNSVYVSMAHTEPILEKYFGELEGVFQVIADCEKGKKNVNELLEGPVCHAGFKRLN